ncbi:PREDICTED: breast cancer anti-estrogen resistance protein 1 isoform X2 [Nicrophorus vespilloides]|uniref:Breast cancer anti-estrogen resistance protein 1 isoform X2 n=1 Tax=Nicrophorus vespilloides TaxID=110193 RepID=A0ABM1N274_NICVS|nr:PREDICTED: breast cancer anti-estrogen resistance protein 1 isoform X2 [Nicrophorus vespilloides]
MYVLTPRKINDVYLYDMPPMRCSPIPVSNLSPSQSSELYDVPPRAVPVNYETRSNCPRCSPAPSCISPISKDSQDSYDIPRPLLHSQNLLTPSSSASSLSLTGESFSSSNRSSLINMPDYDIPRSHQKGPQLVLHNTQIYDVPPAQSQIKELPLELSSALETLERLQTETTTVTSKLLGFVTPKWRTYEKLEQNIMEIKLVVIRLKTSLHDFAEFCEGALGNATRATDKNLAGKLVNLVMALKNSDKLIHDATEKLQLQNWSLDFLAKPVEDEHYKLDELEQVIACAKALTEDIRQAASFIQGNSTLLFKKDTSPPTNNNETGEDYDYVNLESKEANARSNTEIRNALPKELQKNFDCLLKNANDAAIDNAILDPDDKHVLTFFAAQAATHHNNLTQAIDAFLQTVEHNQPPKIFLAHGKFVVLSAHKLVYIGDTVHRNVNKMEIKMRALGCANALNEALATSVTKTKQAALQFPSVTAVQEMVDSVVDISHLARDMKLCLVQAAQP